MKIRTKLMGIGGVALIALTALYVVIFFENLSIEEATTETSLREQQIALISQLKAAQLQLTLAAMDSIVDKDEGKVSNQRIAEIKQHSSFLMENIPALEQMADTEEEALIAQELKGDVEKLVRGVQHDLVKLVSENGLTLKKLEARFAKIDDVLDTQGESIEQKLMQLKQSNNNRETVILLDEMHISLLEVMLIAMDSLVDKDEGAISPERLAALESAFSHLMDHVETLSYAVAGRSDRNTVQSIKQNLGELEDGIKNQLASLIVESAAAKQNIETAFSNIDDILDKNSNEIEQKLNSYYTSVSEEAATADTELLAGLEKAGLTALATYIAASVLLIAILFSICKSILNPLRDAVTFTHQIAEGDFSVRLDANGKDEISMLGSAMNDMTERLSEMMARINDAATLLTKAAADMGAVTEQTHQGIREQQLQADQVATAANQMVASVQEVANSAQMAAVSANEADNAATSGAAVVNEAVEAINILAADINTAASTIQSLEKGSEEIGRVIDVIKDIAEQTNLLALNAAIEAARAGEYGRGFAVVADEVRGLASRTQESTQEIQNMIERIQENSSKAVSDMDRSRTRAQAGVEKAAAAGESLELITQAVSTINSMNTQIASASEEQSAVSEQICQNVVNISRVADETEQGANQTSENGKLLSGLAKQLTQEVSYFKIA